MKIPPRLLPLALVWLAGGPPPLAAAAAAAAADFTAEEIALGQQRFVVHCARCHGMQGLGGTGPNLAQPVLSRAPDLPTLLTVIEKGLPGTAMPETWMLSPKDVRALAGYVLSLGRSAEAPPTGDPARGRELFTRTACTQCHTVDGQGGIKGPELSAVGRRRGATRLRQMLTEPGKVKTANPDGFTEYLFVKLTTTSGVAVEGLRVNEDGFTIQVRDLEDRIHSFRKTELREITKNFEQSIMPSFAAVFSAAELDDLIAYLSTLKGNK